jgi:ankyrin repeat protein
MDDCLNAISANDFSVFQDLISKMTDTSLIEEYLYFACFYENERMVRHLLQRRVSPNHVHFHTYPLRSIARMGNLPIAKVLVEHGAFLELPSSLYVTYYTPPIIEACEYDRNEMVQWLVSQKADLHTQNHHTRETPLLIACRRYNLSLVDYILSIDNSGLPDMNVENQTVLHMAMKRLNMPMLEVLLRHGMAYHVRLCAHVLRDAMSHHPYDTMFDLVQLFLRHGFSTNYPIPHGHLLIYFIKSGNVAHVRYILEHDACDVNLPSVDETPLHVACSNSTADMVELLLSYQPQLDLQDYKGDTPLCIACMKNDVAMVRLLLHHGAEDHLVIGANSTMLKAIVFSRVEIVALFFYYGANPLQVIEGRTLRQIVDVERMPFTKPALKNLLADAEDAARSTPQTVEHAFFTRHEMDFSTWERVLSSAARQAFYHFVRDDEMDPRACYTALHFGEEDTLNKYRSGEEVCFSPAAIRCLGRSYGTRALRKRITSYLVFPSRERHLLQEARLHHGNAVPF